MSDMNAFVNEYYNDIVKCCNAYWRKKAADSPLPIDVEDLAHEVCIALITRNKFDPQRPNANARALIKMVTRNTYLMMLRASSNIRKRDALARFDMYVETEFDDGDPTE